MTDTSTSLVPAGDTNVGAGRGNAFDMEIGSIEKTMREKRHEYDRDPKMSARYLELLRARGAGREPAKVDATDPRRELPADVIREWDKGGDASFRANHERVMNVLAHIGSGLPDETAARGFLSSFEGLGPEVTSAALLELARGSANFAKPATASDVEAFGRFSANTKAIVAAWGDAAPRRLGNVMGRWQRFLASLDKNDQHAAGWWLDRLGPKEQAALFWALAR